MIDLCGEWRFNDTTIRVPALWEAQGHLELDGSATYERDIEVGSDLPFAMLEFGAVADLCDVYLNDDHVGSHEVGFTPFAFPVALRRGRNVVRVEVTDPPRDHPDFLRTPQGKQGWGNRPFPSPPSVYITYGGIWQPARIVPHLGAYVCDVWCDMDPGGPAVHVEVEGHADDIEIRAFGQTVRGDHARFDAQTDRWPGALNDIEVTAYVGGEPSHSRTLRTGLRTLQRDGDELLLNGKPYRMRSALHQGFWPNGLYAADPELIERDIDLALGAGLNTLRTHLKAFEPEWLDAADRKGLLLHCDLPLGEPLRDATLLDDETFIRRCLVAAREQVKRDRSRPSIIAWTIFNEVGLVEPGMLETEAYRSLVAQLHDTVRDLDPSRPIIENDWVLERKHLVRSDVRTAHWYGRTTKEFMDVIDARVSEAASESGPFYVSEFGEWGLPSREPQTAFFDQDFEHVIREAGWQGDVDEFIAGTQSAQGWADRIQAERFRIAPHVHGFCLTEWTDVPHELNGLVSLRRNKKESIEAFRPALADVARIAIVDRYAYARGETIEAHLYVSDWTTGTVEDLGPRAFSTTDPPAGYAFHVCEPREPNPDVPVYYGEAPDDVRPAVLIEPTSLPELAGVPTNWGPTPIPFTDGTLDALPKNAVLAHELFACYPEVMLAGVHGPLGLLVVEPVDMWGALIAERDGLVVCTLRVRGALERGEGFAKALLADLTDLAAGDERTFG